MEAAFGHEGPFPRDETTYTIAAPAAPDPDQPILRLNAETPARFTILIDGKPSTPPALNVHGIHFTSIHTGKKTNATILYTRGTGPTECNLPAEAKQAEIIVTCGLETLPLRTRLDLPAEQTHEITAPPQPLIRPPRPGLDQLRRTPPLRTLRPGPRRRLVHDVAR